MFVTWNQVVCLGIHELPEFPIVLFSRLGTPIFDCNVLDDFIELFASHRSPIDFGHLFQLSFASKTLSQAAKDSLVIKWFCFASIGLLLG